MKPGSVHFSGVPLSSSGWLSSGYVLTQADLEKWLIQLCRALQPLHEKHRIYGTVSPEHVLLDPQGVMHVAARRALLAESRTTSRDLYDGTNQGFSAFEQYVDDPSWPQGPWTDIYGMSALARTLILKQPPPDAVQRMVSDTCVPLREMGLSDYSSEFLDTIDRGMSLLPQQRFASVDAYAETLGLSLAAVSKDENDSAPDMLAPQAADVSPLQLIAPVSAPESTPAPASAGQPQEEKKAPIWMIAFVVLALIAAGGYLLSGQNAGTPATAMPQASEVAAVPQAVQATDPMPEAVAAQEPVDRAEPTPALAPQPELVDEASIASSFVMTPETEAPQAAVVEPPSIDVEAHTAARVALIAAEQEAMAQQPVEQQAVQEESDATGIEPIQEAQVKKARTSEEAAGANVRVGVSIKPWGEVFINGASRGVSPPLRSLSLEPGEYRVRIVNGDLPPLQQTLTVQAGEPASIAHDFESGN